MHDLNFGKIRKGICTKILRTLAHVNKLCVISLIRYQKTSELTQSLWNTSQMRGKRENTIFSADMGKTNANKNTKLANLVLAIGDQAQNTCFSSKLPQYNPDVQPFLQLIQPMIQSQIRGMVEEELGLRN